MKKNHIELSIEDYKGTIYHQGGKGLEKYGQPMDPLEDGRDWLQMADEELVDGHQYLVAEKIKRRYIVAEIKKKLNNALVHLSTVQEIERLLDKLEGK